MRKIILLFGGLSGLAMVASFAIYYAFNDVNSPENYQASETFGYLSMVVALLGIFFGIKRYRNRHLNGEIHFGRAFLTGLGISIVAGVLFGLYCYLLYAYIDPGFLPRYYEAYKEQLLASDQLTAEQKQGELTRMKNMNNFLYNEWAQGGVMSVTVWFVGAFISVVCAIGLRRKLVIKKNG